MPGSEPLCSLPYPLECTTVDLTEQLEEAMKVDRFSVGLENMTVIREHSARPIIQAGSEDKNKKNCANLCQPDHECLTGHGSFRHVDPLDRTYQSHDHDHHRRYGPVIQQEHIRKIFEPFYTTKSPGKGTGLDLYFVGSLIEAHQGQIGNHIAVGEGRTCCLEFPLSPETVLCQKTLISVL